MESHGFLQLRNCRGPSQASTIPNTLLLMGLGQLRLATLTWIASKLSIFSFLSFFSWITAFEFSSSSSSWRVLYLLVPPNLTWSPDVVPASLDSSTFHTSLCHFLHTFPFLAEPGMFSRFVTLARGYLSSPLCTGVSISSSASLNLSFSFLHPH